MSEFAIETKKLNVHYGDKHAIKDVSLAFPKNQVIALIGPSGCGKSTYLRSLNRMNDEIEGCRSEGPILYHGRDVNTAAEDLYELRKNIGMVFQKPNPFTKSIYKNITFALKRHGIKEKHVLEERVEKA